MSGSEVDGKSGKKTFKRSRNFLLIMYRATRKGCCEIAVKYWGRLLKIGLTDEEIFEQLDRIAGAGA